MQARIWDESISVVLPRAIFTAFPLSIWDHGDKIGARMAFKDAYPAALEKYGGETSVSLGDDAEGHAPCVLGALRDGLIGRDRAKGMLPHLSDVIDAIEPPEEQARLEKQDG